MMSAGSTYRHTQAGIVIVLTVGIAALALILAVYMGALPKLVLIAPGALLVCLRLFGSLTVEVDDKAVKVRFGPGLVRRSFKLAEIKAVRIARNRWIHGWGIHWIWRGWLWNVSGFDAVEIDLASGSSHRIGTDEPQKLLEAIRQAAGLAG